MLCTLTGWGYITPYRVGMPPNNLQCLNQTTLTNDECREDGRDVVEDGICTYARMGRGSCGVRIFSLVLNSVYQLELCSDF